jgi:16S rRNA (guanine966-N2)-methyltransferase
VTGGRFGGRTLVAPAGRAVRPTSDRVRESLFARLGALDHARVLDLYAGTGSLGIEALSRGAESVVFVERAAAAVTALRRNLEALGLDSGCSPARLLREDAARAVRRLGRQGERFDLVLLDPPYASDELERALEVLAEARVLLPTAEVVAEAPRRHPLPAPGGLTLRETRRYGDTLIARYGPQPERATEAADE